MERVIRPQWPAPPSVCAASTERGLDPEQAWRMLEAPGEPRWLSQVHGAHMVSADEDWRHAQADGCVSFSAGRTCMLLTADCLPVLLCDHAGSRVAAVHAGWRGLAAGVIRSAVGALCRGGGRPLDASELMAWIGPGIGPSAYQVGSDVFGSIMETPDGAARFFAPQGEGRWLMDLAGLARRQLRRLGVARIYGGRWCTYSDPQRFHSYRRDGGSARQATFIWLRP
ncbi:MAG: peptidoglycan editing factor PgeF [Gammaproteobacteria bacterium]|nr:peptidoglycan editing factor PgeF [Gammaproteobacteria bacterium]